MNLIKKLFRKKSFIALLVIAAGIGGYFIYKNLTATPITTRYVTEDAVKGTISVSVAGTGQVASTNQVDIKPSAASMIVSLPITQGQTVAKGQLLASLDSRSAQRAVSDAETSLETAKLNLQKAMEPTDSLTKLQQENSLISAQNSLQKAKDDLVKAYDDAFTAVSNAFLDLPELVTGMQDILMGNEANTNQWNINFYSDAAKQFDERADRYREDAYESYLAARKEYDDAFAAFKESQRGSDPEDIMKLISETHTTTLAIAEAVKETNNLLQFYKDKLTEKNLNPIALADTQLSLLNNFTGTANSNVSSLASAKRTIENDIQAIDDSERSIVEKQATVDKANAGPDTLDIRSLQISIDQKQNALQDAKDKLADYYVRSPFAGIIASVSASIGDQASSGTTIATLLANQQVTDISLNEVDVAKVKIGQKATLAFDAIEDLIITGNVSAIDLIGTVSQGVVSYNAKIVFDTQDDRIKSGMSVSAAIITDTHLDVLTVPASAVKTQGNESYVQLLENELPVRKTVVTGLANDTHIEIISGVAEGDQVITQTITTGGSAKTTTATGTSALGGLGGGAIRGVTGGGGAPSGFR